MELDKVKVYYALSEVIDYVDYDVWKRLMHVEDTGEDDTETFSNLVDMFVRIYNGEA